MEREHHRRGPTWWVQSAEDSRKFRLDESVVSQSTVFQSMVENTSDDDDGGTIRLNASRAVIETVESWTTTRQKRRDKEWEELFFSDIIKRKIATQVLYLSEFLEIRELTAALNKRMASLCHGLYDGDVLEKFAIDENLDDVVATTTTTTVDASKTPSSSSTLGDLDVVIVIDNTDTDAAAATTTTEDEVIVVVL